MDAPQCRVLLTDGELCLAKHFSTQAHRKNLASLRDPNRLQVVNTIQEEVLTPTVNKPSRKEYMKDYMRKRRLAKTLEG